jgi:uncharacterized membrane protein
MNILLNVSKILLQLILRHELRYHRATDRTRRFLLLQSLGTCITAMIMTTWVKDRILLRGQTNGALVSSFVFIDAQVTKINGGGRRFNNLNARLFHAIEKLMSITLRERNVRRWYEIFPTIFPNILRKLTICIRIITLRDNLHPQLAVFQHTPQPHQIHLHSFAICIKAMIFS